MEEKEIILDEENKSVLPNDELPEEIEDNEPLDKNVKLMSPTQMVIRRFFRSKLSIVGLIMVVSLFVFSFLGPVFYNRWGETEPDESGGMDYTQKEFTYVDENGTEHTVMQTIEKQKKDNSYAPMSKDHLLGTDNYGYDIFTRLMYGGRISLLVSFLAVFVITALGVIFGGIAGYYGGKVDNIIMRICDIFMCVPGIPLLIIINEFIGTDGYNVPMEYRIYVMMFCLTFFSWSGTARLVRGQILSIREQEYMIAADAMGYSASRKIFKHLVPNVMPQLIVQMTLSLGSMILYESTLSYLGMGVQLPHAAWGTMISIISSGEGETILTNYFNIWGAPGICIIIAVLGFNFVGDGLRDALDPKMRR